MATIKAFTDISQSKTLSKILPLESADMRFCFSSTLGGRITGHYPMIGREPSMGTIPCWSLAALLDVIPSGKALIHDKGNLGYKCICNNMDTYFYNNPVDACVEMIFKLHEQKLL